MHLNSPFLILNNLGSRHRPEHIILVNLDIFSTTNSVAINKGIVAWTCSVYNKHKMAME